MATKTPNLELWKPGLNDALSPDLFNANSDIIDAWAADLTAPAHIAKGSYVGTGNTKSWYNNTINLQTAIDSTCRRALSMAYGSGKIVICMYHRDTSYTQGSGEYYRTYVSTNGGTSWTSVGSYDFNMIEYINGVFYGIKFNSYSYLYIYRSTDATTWTQVYSITNTSTTPNDLIYGNGVFILTCDSGMLYSTDGTNWSSITPSISGITSISGIKVTYGNNMFVGTLVGYTGSIYKLYTMRSTNGSTWTNTDSGVIISSAMVVPVIYKDSSFYMLVNGKLYSSVSGVGWSITSNTSYAYEVSRNSYYQQRTLNGVTFAGNRFSKDLLVWDKIPVTGDTYYYYYLDAGRIIYDGTKYIAAYGTTLYMIPANFMNDDKTVNLSFTPKVLLLNGYGGDTVNFLGANYSTNYDIKLSQNSFIVRRRYVSDTSSIKVDDPHTRYTYVAIG